MANTIPLGRQITIGTQLSEPELRALAAEGVRALVNLTPHGEAPETFPSAAEAPLARQLGMVYLDIPVALNELRSTERLDEFLNGFARLPRPVHVHCRSGWRAGIYVAIALGIEQGLSGAEALGRVRQLGFDPGPGEPAEFIVSQTDLYQKKSPRG